MPKKETQRHTFAFEVWYSMDRDVKKTLDNLRHQTPPYRVSRATFYNWINDFGWNERADERDRKIQKKLMQDAVQERADFIQKKATVGKLMQRRALEFFQQEFPLDANTGKPVKIHIDNAHVAATVMQMGLSLEEQALGLPEWMSDLLVEDDEEVFESYYQAALEELRDVAEAHAGEGAEEEETFPAVLIESVSSNCKD